jgi:hypothetical protein
MAIPRASRPWALDTTFAGRGHLPVDGRSGLDVPPLAQRLALAFFVELEHEDAIELQRGACRCDLEPGCQCATPVLPLTEITFDSNFTSRCSTVTVRQYSSMAARPCLGASKGISW